MTPDPERARELFFRAVGHFEAGRLDDARALFEQCLALAPGRPSVQGNLGITLWRLGRAREALPLLASATAAEPAFAEAWSALGLAREALGEFTAAAQALRHALDLAPAAAPLWLALGRCLARCGQGDQALGALDRALALDPAQAEAWSLRGSLLREAGRLDDAAASFERALAHGADRELHAFYLASVRGTAAPPSAPPAYVEALFDDYAADFDRHLVDQLGYRAHEQLLQPLLASGRRFARVLDLGCGTGLCGQALAGCSDAIVGVDLSQAMLDRAAALKVYRELVHADAAQYLAACAQRFDLVVAADVLIYLGALEPVFAGVARVLAPGGRFAFSVESAAAGCALQLLPSLRYAHAEDSVRQAAAAYGFAVEDLRSAAIRHEQGRPVAGLYVTLSR